MKSERFENYRVEVSPKNPYIRTSPRQGETQKQADHRQMISVLRECEQQIKRHVDGYGDTAINYDTIPVCSHCGERWTEDSPAYNGGCCSEDEANNPENATPALGKEQANG